MGGVMTFCRTVTTAFATAMVGFVLGGANYMESTAGELVNQSPETLLAIRLLLGISVTVLLSLGFIASLKYKVTNKKLERIRFFVEKRREDGIESLTAEERTEYAQLMKELV
jgi:Na+/melibiose symporter-like transporter